MKKIAISLIAVMVISVGFLSGCEEQAATKKEDTTIEGAQDTDGDGLNNTLENFWNTNPLVEDTDGDGYSDGMEVNFLHTPPYEELSKDLDSDGDGIPNEVETMLGTDIDSDDSDSDGLDDFKELRWFCDPLDKDTNLNGVSDFNDILSYTPPWKTLPDGVDKDGDGLPDGVEIMEILTDPKSASTDGDRYSDYMEWSGINLPSYVKGKAASPFYPAVPDIQIVPSTSFEIYLAREITAADETISEGTYVFNSGYQETTNSLFNWFIEAGVEGDIFKAIFSGQLPFYIKGGTYYSSQHTTNLYCSETNIMSTKERWYRAEKTNLADSYISVPLSIKNIGSDILQSEIADIVVNLYIGNNTSPSLDTWHLAGENYHISKLKPGDSSVTITAKFYGFTVDKLKRIDMGEAIRVVIDQFSFGEDELYLLDAMNRLIKVTIDDGVSVIYDYVRPDDANTFVDIISSIANIVVENEEIISVGGLSKTAHSAWNVIVPTSKEIDTIDELFSNVFIAGDEIVLTYLKDSDGDKIIDREERLLGLNPFSNDSDSDTLNDYDELSGNYNSNPILADTDFDDLDDKEEVVAGMDGYITNPSSSDTDSDGLNDFKEYENGTNPNLADTDGDDLSDSDELIVYFSDPLDNDSDDDGIEDGIEVSQGTSPIGTFYPTDDSFVDEQSPNENYGDEAFMIVRNYNGWWFSDNWAYETHIKFDLSVIPSGLSIVDAKLFLYYYDYVNDNPVGHPLSLYGITSDWNEYTLKWNNQSSAVLEPTSIATVPSDKGEWIQWDVTNDVQNFTDGSSQNYGWKILDDYIWNDTDIPSIKFRSKEYYDSSFHPYLELSFV